MLVVWVNKSPRRTAVLNHYTREREPSLICVFVGRASTLPLLLYNGTYVFAATIWLINIARLGTDKNLGPTE